MAFCGPPPFFFNSSVSKELTWADVRQVTGISCDAFAVDNERLGSIVTNKLEKISGIVVGEHVTN